MTCGIFLQTFVAKNCNQIDCLVVVRSIFVEHLKIKSKVKLFFILNVFTQFEGFESHYRREYCRVIEISRYDVSNFIRRYACMFIIINLV